MVKKISFILQTNNLSFLDKTFPRGSDNFCIRIWSGPLLNLQKHPYSAICMLLCCELFWKSFSIDFSRSYHVDISTWEYVPMTIYNLNETNRIIMLSSGNDYWAQQVYQLAHELTHFFIGGTEERHNNWFYESLAELASNFFLRKMADRCSKFADNRLQSYSHCFAEYETALSRSADCKNMAVWLKEKENYLFQNKIDRPCNAIVAKRLLSYFLEEDDIWNILLFAPHQNTNLKDLFGKWNERIHDKYAYLRRHLRYFQGVFCV